MAEDVQMSMRSLLLGLMLSISLVGCTSEKQSSDEPPLSGDTLSLADPLFWTQSDPDVDGPFLYEFSVAEEAVAMVVTLDTARRTDRLIVNITGPDGEVGEFAKTYAYDGRSYIEGPAVGDWTLEVTPEEGSRAFGLHAGLLSDEPENQSFPNLRAVAPFAPTFNGPVDIHGLDYDNEPELGAPVISESCTEDEIEELDAERCLRFSAGLENAGAGPLLLSFDTRDPSREMIQEIARTDRKPLRESAGKFEYHPTHNHFHYRNIWKFELLEVLDDSTGEMEPAGGGGKSGFCPADQLLADRGTFEQEGVSSHLSDCGMDYDVNPLAKDATPLKGPAAMALSAGWGDVYAWYRPGNYVEFSDNDDGLYVIQVIVDPDRNVLETDETDNVAYALVEVQGTEITVLERGRGTDPWDPEKDILEDWFSTSYS